MIELEFHQLDLRYERLRITTPESKSRLLSSLASCGQQSPVMVVESDEANHYILIDGYIRVLCLRELKRDTVQALILSIPECDALIFYHRQAHSRVRTALEDGWFLQTLSLEYDFGLSELASRLGRSKGWVSRRLSLVQVLAKSVQAFVREGKICPDSAMKYLVPLSRDNESDCIELSTKISQARLSSRQIGHLYHGWRKASIEGKKRIVQEPLLYLKAKETANLPASAISLDANEELLFREIEGLCSKCFRVRKKIEEKKMALSFPCNSRLRDVWNETHASFSILSSLLEEQINVGSGYQGGDLKTS